MLYASSYKKEPWTNWFGTDGIVYPDLTIGDVMVDPYEQHMELEQRLAVAYPQMKEAFNNGTAYAWFNGKKNELTLRNMTLNCGAIGEEVRPISTAHDINVNLEGDNHFTGRVTTGMYFGGLTTLNITGTTQIDMEGDCYSLDGIVSNGDGLYLKGGGELIIDVDDEGIRSENILSIDNTRLTLRSQERSGITGGTLHLSGKKTIVNIDSYHDCISGVDDLELEDGLTIVMPEGAQFYHNAVRDQNGVVLSGQMEISVPKVECPLVVCGVVVNNVNEDDLLAEMPTTEGYIVNKTDDSALYYDNDTQTLTMRNVQVTLPDDVEVIHNGLNDSFVENLKVNIEGECSFNGSAGIFERDGGILFIGNGTLMVNAGEGCGLRVFTRAEVDGPTVVLNSTDSGVFAYNSTEDATLAVTSGTLKVTGGIVCFRLELAEEMGILSPNRAHFGLSDNGVHYGVVNEDDALVVGEIVIGERNSYYVFVGGVELTKELCQNPDALVEILAEKDDQLMEDYFEGTVEIYYIPETKTLHLKNFRINLNNEDGIVNGGFIRGANRHGVLGFNIEVEGDCSITTEGTVPVYDFNGPITLTGGGTLTLRSDNNIGICCYDDFTLDGPTVASEGTIGFYCSEPYKETRANILGGTLKVKGSDKCILAEQLNLGEGIFITKPDGAQWNDSYYSVVDADGNIVKNEWVVIGTAIATGISDEGILMKNESLNAQTVYDLQGRRISMQHPSSITSGIYIVNSRKVIVR